MRESAVLLLSTTVLLTLCLGQVAAVTAQVAVGTGTIRAPNETTTTATAASSSTTPAARSTDSDDDGLSDDRERETFETDPFTADTDGDGLADGEEVHQYQTNPNAPDTDGDGLTDGLEIELGTDLTQVDTDGDGVSDGEEVDAGTDPTNANSFPTDGSHRPTIGNGSAAGSAETGLRGPVTENALPILTFIGGLVTAFGLLKIVRFYRYTQSPVIVRLDDDDP